MFGKWILPMFDIDCQPTENEDINLDINHTIRVLAKALDIDECEFKHVNRSRQLEKGYKYSYHITVPRFCIQRVELSHLVVKIKNEEAQRGELSLINSLDACIYRNKGSLRISDNSVFYRTELYQLSFYSPKDAQRLQKIKDLKQAKLTDSAEKSVEKVTEDFLKSNGIEGWKFRSAKAFKTYTIVNLDRQSNAKAYCTLCKRDHHKDNCLYLKMTAKRTELCCMKNRGK